MTDKTKDTIPQPVEWDEKGLPVFGCREDFAKWYNTINRFYADTNAQEYKTLCQIMQKEINKINSFHEKMILEYQEKTLDMIIEIMNERDKKRSFLEWLIGVKSR